MHVVHAEHDIGLYSYYCHKCDEYLLNIRWRKSEGRRL